MKTRSLSLSNESVEELISYEIGGEFPGDLRYYNKFCAPPHWPGVASGVTFGIGYDAGYQTREQIRRDWEGLVNGNILSFMMSVAGVKGQAAKARITPAARGFRIEYPVAKQVFVNKLLPRFCRLALNTYPGLEKLNHCTQGVIVSLVFNRGADLVDNTPGEKAERRRSEMAALKPLIARADYVGIAREIVSMKRLWDGVPDYPGDNEERSNGLLKRRDREAKLVLDSVSKSYAVNDLITVSFA